MRISDWSSDVCSSDLRSAWPHGHDEGAVSCRRVPLGLEQGHAAIGHVEGRAEDAGDRLVLGLDVDAEEVGRRGPTTAAAALGDLSGAPRPVAKSDTPRGGNEVVRTCDSWWWRVF